MIATNLCLFNRWLNQSSHIPPPKTNMTGWKIHHEWVDVFPIEPREIFQPVMWSFSGVYVIWSFSACWQEKRSAALDPWQLQEGLPQPTRLYWNEPHTQQRQTDASLLACQEDSGFEVLHMQIALFLNWFLYGTLYDDLPFGYLFSI